MKISPWVSQNNKTVFCAVNYGNFRDIPFEKVQHIDVDI